MDEREWIRKETAVDSQKIITQRTHFGVFILNNKLTALIFRYIAKFTFLWRATVFLKGNKIFPVFSQTHKNILFSPWPHVSAN